MQGLQEQLQGATINAALESIAGVEAETGRSSLHERNRCQEHDGGCQQAQATAYRLLLQRFLKSKRKFWHYMLPELLGNAVLPTENLRSL